MKVYRNKQGELCVRIVLPVIVEFALLSAWKCTADEMPGRLKEKLDLAMRAWFTGGDA